MAPVAVGRWRRSLVVAAAFLVVALGEAVIAASPRLTVVTGGSMVPVLSQGDVAIVVRAEGYKVGDIVAYRDPLLGLVIHRIVHVEDGRFVTAGDANTWPDLHGPSAEEIDGRLAVSVPTVGAAVRLMRQPPATGAVAALLALAVIAPPSRRVLAVASSALVVGAALGLAAQGVVAAGNGVAASGVAQVDVAINATALRPPECAALAPTAIVVGAGTVVGTAASELVLGSPGSDVMRGEPDVGDSAGDDCLLGGGGVDDLHGDNPLSPLLGADDVLVGGPGDDILNGGMGTDTCHAAGGADTFTSCETQLP